FRSNSSHSLFSVTKLYYCSTKHNNIKQHSNKLHSTIQEKQYQFTKQPIMEQSSEKKSHKRPKRKSITSTDKSSKRIKHHPESPKSQSTSLQREEKKSTSHENAKQVDGIPDSEVIEAILNESKVVHISPSQIPSKLTEKSKLQLCKCLTCS